MRVIITLICLCNFYANALTTNHTQKTNLTIEITKPKLPVGCYCGIFMSGQLKTGNVKELKENPVFMYKGPATLACTSTGKRICINKCLSLIIKYISNSARILCKALKRDCVKERAHLFIKTCNKEWINANLSASKEYCCKDGTPYKCPMF